MVATSPSLFVQCGRKDEGRGEIDIWERRRKPTPSSSTGSRLPFTPVLTLGTMKSAETMTSARRCNEFTRCSDRPEHTTRSGAPSLWSAASINFVEASAERRSHIGARIRSHAPLATEKSIETLATNVAGGDQLPESGTDREGEASALNAGVYPKPAVRADVRPAVDAHGSRSANTTGCSKYLDPTCEQLPVRDTWPEQRRHNEGDASRMPPHCEGRYAPQLALSSSLISPTLARARTASTMRGMRAARGTASPSR